MSVIVKANNSSFLRAAHILQRGGLVAFPTETVYGLGADATNDTAVAKIFAAKERPNFNPLIVHVSNLETAQALAYFDKRADLVAKAFWPGPISLVLPRRDNCDLSLLVSAGLDTVAIRVPSDPDTQHLLKKTSRPIAAPSANRSCGISPTIAQHVEMSLPAPSEGGPELILDGGPCDVGLESSVVDLTGATATLLRPGCITRETLSNLLNDLVLAGPNNTVPKSPGMLQRHYAPKTPLKINSTVAMRGEAMLGFGSYAKNPTLNLSPEADLYEAAGNFFSMLHRLDNAGFLAINVAPIPDKEIGQAINDRLRRAAFIV